MLCLGAGPAYAAQSQQSAQPRDYEYNSYGQIIRTYTHTIDDDTGSLVRITVTEYEYNELGEVAPPDAPSPEYAPTTEQVDRPQMVRKLAVRASSHKYKRPSSKM